MSASPQSNSKDVEQGVQSPDEEGAQMNDPQDPHSTGLAYEFEVKEQDRWLPIANGMSPICSPNRLPWCPPFFHYPLHLMIRLSLAQLLLDAEPLCIGDLETRDQYCSLTGYQLSVGSWVSVCCCYCFQD